MSHGYDELQGVHTPNDIFMRKRILDVLHRSIILVVFIQTYQL